MRPVNQEIIVVDENEALSIAFNKQFDLPEGPLCGLHTIATATDGPLGAKDTFVRAAAGGEDIAELIPFEVLFENIIRK